MNIALNGFGRIGRTFLRVLLHDQHAHQKIRIVGINMGPSSSAHAAHLFKYDTIMGTYPGSVQINGTVLTIDEQQIQLCNELTPSTCPWKSLDIDWVVECSGKFTTGEQAQQHVGAGAQGVLISAPASGADIVIVPGVNDHAFDVNKHKIVSLGSCTTNALLPTLHILHRRFGIEQGYMTTVHAYTNSQVLLDSDEKDLRRTRAAALNIIPTSSGASMMVGKIIPELSGKIECVALRVPVADVSLLDLTFKAKGSLSPESINDALRAAAKTELRGIVGFCAEPLVSSDYIGSDYSVIFDSLLTQATGAMGKVFGWYDNEWGYCQRLKDFLLARV